MHQLRSPVRVKNENFFPVVFLPVDKRHEQAAGIGTEYVLQNTRIKIVFELTIVPHRVPGIVQQGGVTTTARGPRLSELVVS